METTDIFATKGLEYIIVLAYLAALAAYWILTSYPRRAPALAGPGSAREWFEPPRELHFHPGHTWVAAEGPEVVRVGMDEFALRLLGRSAIVTLPPIGQPVRSGEPAWAFESEGESIPVLAPVHGEVLEVNEAARQSSELLHAHPYDSWLLKVKVRSAPTSLKNLLSGRLARAWMEDALAKLWPAGSGGVGVAMADGGGLVDGFARALEPDRWAEVAREFLLTNQTGLQTDEEEVVP
jgi:glycine cleavage system H protein